MPFVSITLREGKSEAFLKTLSETIHKAMVSTIACPPETLYHEILQTGKNGRVYLPQYRGMERTEDMIFIRMILKEGRTAEQKNAMYRLICKELHRELGIRTEDLFITLTENKAEDWFFGLKAE